jgi:NitT/TauT family transport system permease protein
MTLLRNLAPVLAAAVLFLVGWRLVVALGGYPAFILPAPEVVGARLVRAATDGTLQPHVMATLSAVGLGLAVGSGLALVVGYLLARSALAERLLSPYLVAAQATPILALAPLIALWFGSGLGSKVAVATMVGIRAVDARLLELGRSLRASRWQVFRHLELPAATPQILGGLRVGVTLAVVGAIVAEWAAPGTHGLGMLVLLARGSLFDIPLMFAALVTIALIGVALYLAVVVVERRLVGAWRSQT